MFFYSNAEEHCAETSNYLYDVIFLSGTTITYVDVIHLTVMPLITIKFDFKTTLQISMPKQHSYNIQGLCGNNNGDASGTLFSFFFIVFLK